MRKELIVCDHCKAARDSKEPGGATLQIFSSSNTYVADLCDTCLGALQLKLISPRIPGLGLGGSPGSIEFFGK